MPIPITRLRLLTLTMLMMLAPGLAGFSALAQEEPELPIEIPVTRGVDMTIQALAEMSLEPIEAPHLIVERYVFNGGTEFGPYTPTGPQMLVLEEGEILLSDERGFRQALQPPFQTALQAGDEVSWTIGERTSMLMMGFTSGSAVPPVPAAETERIGAFPLSEIPSGTQEVFYGTIEIDASAGEFTLNHDGMVALQVQDGSLELISPSGLEGTLGEVGSIVFPNGTPIEVLGSTHEDATVLFAGIGSSPSPESLFEAVSYDPCNVSTVQCTDPDSTLANGGNWVGVTASLRLNTSHQGNNLVLRFTYRNTGDQPEEFHVHPEDVTVRWEAGEAWQTPAGRSLVTVDPDQITTVVWAFEPPSRGGGDVVIEVASFGDIHGATWRVQAYE